jgi:CheY-like chemotaxis protein
LVADQSLPNRRLITEILTSFHKCEVDASSSAEHAFERILHQPYDLFIFAFTLPDMNGLLLDRLAARVHTLIHPAKATAPPVIFLVPVNESAAYKEAQRDARTRGSVPLPISLDVLMTLVAPLLPSKI